LIVIRSALRPTLWKTTMAFCPNGVVPSLSEAQHVAEDD
jgi:hypothetical protein